MWPFSKKKTIQEGYDATVFGQPYPFEKLWNYRYWGGYTPIIMRDPWSWKPSTLRNIQDLDRVRQMGRWLTEVNPYAHGLLVGLRAFVIGDGFEKHAVSKEGKDKRMTQQVDDILYEFCEHNDLADYELEGYYRCHRDGELFVQLWPNEGTTELRVIEPDAIRVPTAENTEGEWSFGIRHAGFDYCNPLEYNVLYFDNTEEKFPAQVIFHNKYNVVKNVKRGISSYYPVFEILNSAHKLNYAWSEGAKVRESIAYVIESQADKSAIQALNAAKVTDNYTRYGDDGIGRNTDVAQVEPGMVVTIPSGMKYISPPQTSAAAADCIRNGLLAVAARWNAPSWLVTGETSDSSYAAASLPEGLFLRRVEHEQKRQCNYWRKVLKAVVDIEAEKGLLPEDWSEKIDIQVVSPAPISRNRNEEIGTDLQLVQKKLMSQETFCSKWGLDYEQEQEKIANEVPIDQGLIQDPNNPETMSGLQQRDVKAPKPE